MFIDKIKGSKGPSKAVVREFELSQNTTGINLLVNGVLLLWIDKGSDHLELGSQIEELRDLGFKTMNLDGDEVVAVE